ncbi:hypothetical protein [Sediminitomix flava]|uniref:Cytochrome P460 n=1 Tax=Sediminitomix flava TaxID=379075 RepID=A0A316A0R3_SEDFL|nr:hypothetical protein [Sediminitomix flava]PWJ43237.1 hypothetical protein BC781_102786 [Sediminitomix flava]
MKLRTTFLTITWILITVCFQQCKSPKTDETIEVASSTLERAPYLNYPVPLSPKAPFDVDRDLQAKLDAQGKFAEVQRLFEILSWQQFIRLNWPVDAKGNPKPLLSDAGKPRWFSWKESFEVFKKDGSKPTPWGDFELPNRVREFAGENKHVLFRASKFAEFQHDDVADELDQAFTAPIWDQSGNIVRYEVRMNETEFDYIVKNELYNYDGQIKFYQANAGKDKVVNFPSATTDKAGACEVKIAWKIMEEGVDSKDRYFTSTAQVINEDKTFSTAEVGMIGMHISLKTASSPQWIWATFEHVDNLETNPLVEVNGKPLRPSFNNPDCPTCPVNAYPEVDTDGKKRNQIQRVIPISKATQELNAQVQAMLSKADSKLKFYDLVGTQWPTDPSSPAYTYGDTSVYTLPEAVTNKSGGKPTPAYLTNMIMETYFQGGSITPNAKGIDTLKIKQTYLQNGDSIYGNTITGFNVYNSNEPAFFQIQGFPLTTDLQNTHKNIFGTESCIGCHFSASIAKDFYVDKKTNQKVPVFAKPADADFSWLLQLKAHFKEDITQ